MDFQRDENHQMIRDMVRAFALDEVKPGAQARDESGEFPFGLVKKLAELGLMGIMIPEEFGGSGMDVTSFAIIVEELARHDGSLALTVASHNGLGSSHILKFGSEDLKQRFLPSIASGDKLVAWALTEPSSGSDALGMKTTAVKKGDHWILNGSKNFITQGSVGEVFVVLAVTDKDKGSHGVSAFVLERGWEGFTIGKKEDKYGCRSSDTASLSFENVKVPSANLIGQEGEGFIDTLKVLDRGRVIIGAMALGIGKQALEDAAKYAKERVAFAQPIANFQAIQWMLADSAAELEAAEKLIQQAAWLHDQKKFAKKESSMAKLYASEAAWRACNRAIQVHGGYGYVKEYAVERYVRDVKLCEIGEGTSEIQREVIAHQLLDA